jgi:hypothetical protein
MNSKSTAGVLIAGTLILGGGSALAAMLPSRNIAAPTNHSDSGRGHVHSTPQLSSTTQPSGNSPASSVYTVKSGDTLSVVGHWFDAHGYQSVWVTGEAALASQSHLLFPGERIIVRKGTVVVAPPAR